MTTEINAYVPGCCGYRATHKGVTVTVWAQSEMTARTRAATHFGVAKKKHRDITVKLAIRSNGTEVVCAG